jgi:hypothetical protein
MSASEVVLHQRFYEIVSEYHPFAEYIGYSDLEDGFILYYRGSGEEQQMAIDIEGNVVADTTMGTTRSLGLFAAGLSILSVLFGGQSNQTR